MMARQHVTFGVAVATSTLATVSYASESVATWVQGHPFEVALGLIMVAGGCLIPDLDHHGSTMTKKLGWVGWLLHHALAALGVKHRGFLHSAFFGLLCGLFFAVLGILASAFPVFGEFYPYIMLPVFLFFAAITFGFIFGKKGRNPAILVIIAFGYVYGVSQGQVDLTGIWLPIAAMVGPLLHDVGDLLTKSKFAFWAPFSKKQVGAIVGFKTNTPIETVFLRWVFFFWCFAMLLWVALMTTDNLERTDFSQWGDSDTVSESVANALPYITWTLNMSPQQG